MLTLVCHGHASIHVQAKVTQFWDLKGNCLMSNRASSSSHASKVGLSQRHHNQVNACPVKMYTLLVRVGSNKVSMADCHKCIIMLTNQFWHGLKEDALVPKHVMSLDCANTSMFVVRNFTSF